MQLRYRCKTTMVQKLRWKWRGQRQSVSIAQGNKSAAEHTSWLRYCQWSVFICDVWSNISAEQSWQPSYHWPTPKQIKEGSISLKWWEFSMSLMALAAAAIRLFVYQNGCCCGLPPQRIQIALFTAGRRVMARMNDGTDFCGDTKGQERSVTQLYSALCSISRYRCAWFNIHWIWQADGVFWLLFPSILSFKKINNKQKMMLLGKIEWFIFLFIFFGFIY